MLGPARAACCTTACGETLQAGDIIVPPMNAATVCIDNLTISKIAILCKKPNPFRPGFWDIEVKYVFNYLLTFKNSCGADICSILANSVYKTKLTLFGSVGAEIVMASDLFETDCATTSTGPYVTVEAKAIPLAAELKFPSSGCGCKCDCKCGCDCKCRCDCDCCCDDPCPDNAASVLVTIGLFSITKIFRPVNLLVESAGYCIPEECPCSNEETCPCDFFDSIEFPLNIFSPPGNCEFLKGNSNDGGHKKGCGCGCGK